MSAAGWAVRQVRTAVAERGHESRRRAFIREANVPADTCVLVAEHGIGDHFLTGAFVQAVQARHGLKTWLAGDARLEFIGGLFPAVTRYLPCRGDIRRESLTADRVRGGSFFYAHFPGSELLRAVGYRDFHFLDAYRCRLRLPPTASLASARLPSADERGAAIRLLREAGLPAGRTVVLCRSARSTPAPAAGADFWPSLAASLRARGLEPVLNYEPGLEAPPGLKSLKVPLADFRAVAEVAGGICSVRSGLSDLASDLPCPQAVVYAEAHYWAGTLYEGTTLSRHGLAHPPLELILSESDYRRQGEAIADHFQAGIDRERARSR